MTGAQEQSQISRRRLTWQRWGWHGEGMMPVEGALRTGLDEEHSDGESQWIALPHRAPETAGRTMGNMIDVVEGAGGDPE
jgi:hypothetical protein